MKGKDSMKVRIPGNSGPQNMNAMIRQAQKMQEQMAKAQEELEEAEIEGESGSGLVKVVVNGKKVVKSISIDPKAVDPDDVEMLEDLIVAALNTAYEAADEEYEEKMGKFGGAGGLI